MSCGWTPSSTPRCLNQTLHQARIGAIGVAEFRMPLDAEGEGVICAFDRFDEAFVIAGANAPRGRDLAKGLVVARDHL
ncbi:MAG: hypothetical protein ACI9K5_003985 [Gammaproteobacteria bacterium]|jgi:hypothetical protein